MGSRKILYVVLDGLGDEPVPGLRDRTPLEAARTPNLDSIAKRGRSGLVTTVGEGIAPESDVAVMAMLGYDPNAVHSGRGPLEAVGAGLDMRPGDLAWRANFATVDDRLFILDRRAGRDVSSEEASALAAAINAGVVLETASCESTFLATSEHRGVLHLRCEQPLSAEVGNTDPAYERRGHLGVALETFENRPLECKPLDDFEGSRLSAALTNEWTQRAHELLDIHEANSARISRGRPAANFILLRDAGDRLPEVEPLSKRFGMSFACFAEMPVEVGVALVTGMEPIRIDAPGADPGAYAKLAERTVEALDGYDALYVHIKGPDVPAHDGRAEDKRDVIQAIDEGYFATLLPELRRSVIVAVTADHSTSCVRKAHTDDPVPLVIAGGLISPDGSRAYSESDAAAGSLGRLRGVDVLPMLVALARE
jgi:2,3-bisphosphoglycerate-independent phosphoglycerate mutase